VKALPNADSVVIKYIYDNFEDFTCKLTDNKSKLVVDYTFHDVHTTTNSDRTVNILIAHAIPNRLTKVIDN
jgi:hypothetical protein